MSYFSVSLVRRFDDRRSKLQEKPSRPFVFSQNVHFKHVGSVLTSVPPSPGSASYQSYWCGPESWDWL